MRPLIISLSALAVMAAAGLAARSEKQEARTTEAPPEAHGRGERHVMIRPDEVPWQPGPEALPPGAEWAVLEGDPDESDLLAVRVRFPDGYEIPPHWHPVTERVTVLEGEFGMGLGEEFDKDSGATYGPGSFLIVPEGSVHFAWAVGETVIQLNGPGPLEITYVDPADDPRRSE